MVEYGQDTKPVSDFHLGEYSFGYNGCEVIATYNFLVLSGIENVDIPRLAFEFETNALVAADGSMGSQPLDIYALLDYMKLNYSTLSTLDECDTALSQGKNMIFSFWTGTPYFSSIHTVAINSTADGYFVFNRSNSVDGKREITSVSELANVQRAMIIAYTLS